MAGSLRKIVVSALLGAQVGCAVHVKDSEESLIAEDQPGGSGSGSEDKVCSPEGKLKNSVENNPVVAADVENMTSLKLAYAKAPVGKDKADFDKATAKALDDMIASDSIRGGEKNIYQQAEDTVDLFQSKIDGLIAQGAGKFLNATREDGGEHVATFEVKLNKTGEKLMVSRDLLDSVMEMLFLEEQNATDPNGVVLDTAAGYGRMAYRMNEVYPNITYFATDSIPESTYICNKYLTKRESPANVVPLTNVVSLCDIKPTLAMNIHSFSEQTIEDITWWVNFVAELEVKYFFVVPSQSEGPVMLTNGPKKEDISKVLLDAGYKLIAQKPDWKGTGKKDDYFLWEKENNTDDKSDSGSGSGSASKSDSKSDSESDSKSDSKSDSQSDSKSQSGSDSKSGSKGDASASGSKPQDQQKQKQDQNNMNKNKQDDKQKKQDDDDEKQKPPQEKMENGAKQQQQEQQGEKSAAQEPPAGAKPSAGQEAPPAAAAEEGGEAEE